MSIFDPNLYTASTYRCPGHIRTPYSPQYFLAGRGKSSILQARVVENLTSQKKCDYRISKTETVSTIKRSIILYDLIEFTSHICVENRSINKDFTVNRSTCGYSAIGETRENINLFLKRSANHGNVPREDLNSNRVCFDFGSTPKFKISSLKFENSISCALLPKYENFTLKIPCRSYLLGPEILQKIFGSSGNMVGVRACREYQVVEFKQATSPKRAYGATTIPASTTQAPQGACSPSVIGSNKLTKKSRCSSDKSTNVPEMIYGRINAGILKPTFGNGTGRIV